MDRNINRKVSADEISAHEEEVAKFLSDCFEPEDLPLVNKLRISDQLLLVLGRCHMMFQGAAFEDSTSKTTRGLAKNIAWLTKVIRRQCAIENGSAFT